MSKRILITGASGGIGTGVIPGLFQKGYELVLHSRGALDQLQKDCASQGIEATFVSGDLSIEDTVVAIREELEALGKMPDVLFNNAGVSFSSVSWKTETADLDQIMRTNFYTAFLMSKHFVPHMRQQGWGRVVNVSSIVASKPVFGSSVYAASKGAVESFTKGLAMDVVNKGVTANCFAYGYMDAGMIDTLTDEMKAGLLAEIPSGKFGPTADVVAALEYIIGASYVTGETLHINGGYFMA